MSVTGLNKSNTVSDDDDDDDDDDDKGSSDCRMKFVVFIAVKVKIVFFLCYDV
jgi:hypothetical protein